MMLMGICLLTAWVITSKTHVQIGVDIITETGDNRDSEKLRGKPMSKLTNNIVMFETSQKLTDDQIDMLNFMIDETLQSSFFKEEDTPEFTTELTQHSLN